MNKLRLMATLAAFTITSAAWPAFAQDDSGDVPNSARLDVKLSQLEEQMRRMEGAIEQLAYENKQLKAQLDKANADTQYRLQALEGKGAASPAAPAAAAPVTGDQQPPPSGDNVIENGDNAQVAQEPAQSQPAAAPAQQFASSRDHYYYAFRLMNQAKYAEAGASFADFTRLYPHDPLIGNAFYWLGETYYVRRNYLDAADNFRQGYEAMPTGPKAPDNLLKLAMSLDAMKKDSEACVVLKQVVTKYDNSGESVHSRAEQEMNRIGCN